MSTRLTTPCPLSTAGRLCTASLLFALLSAPAGAGPAADSLPVRAMFGSETTATPVGNAAFAPANDAQAAYKARALRIPAGPVANLVTWLASPAGATTTGQVFGVRGRELFLFGQPRPVARMETPAGAFAPAAFGERIDAMLAPLYATLATDLEAFNTEPIL